MLRQKTDQKTGKQPSKRSNWNEHLVYIKKKRERLKENYLEIGVCLKQDISKAVITPNMKNIPDGGNSMLKIQVWKILVHSSDWKKMSMSHFSRRLVWDEVRIINKDQARQKLYTMVKVYFLLCRPELLDRNIKHATNGNHLYNLIFQIHFN